MTIRVELPDNNWAELEAESDMSNLAVKQLRKAARVATGVIKRLSEKGFDRENPDTWDVAQDISDDDDQALDLFQRTALYLRLKSWSLSQPLPADPDEVDNLPRKFFVPLSTAAADVKFDDEEEAAEPSTDPKASTGV